MSESNTEAPAAGSVLERRPSIQERIAMMRSANPENKNPFTPLPTVPAPVPVATPAPIANSVPPSTNVTSCAPASTPASVAAIPPTPETTTNNANITAGADGADGEPKKLSIAERIALMKSQSTTAAVQPQARPPVAPKAFPRAAPTSPANDSTTPPAASNSAEGPPKGLSVAEKIALMKSKSEAASAATPPQPPAHSADGGGAVKTGSSIADRIALIKSNSVAVSAPTDSADHSAPVLGAPRRLSIDKQNFAASINIGGLNPNGPRPPMFHKAASVASYVPESTSFGASSSSKKNTSSIDDSGEFNHLNLSRPTAPTERKKRSMRLPTSTWAEEASTTTSTSAAVTDTESHTLCSIDEQSEH